MPELAEVRLTGDFINQSVTEEMSFIGTWKNPVHKLADLDLTNVLLPDEEFKIRAESRGKELKLYITPQESHPFSVMFTLGMGGHFSFGEVQERPKHTHFSFLTADGERELQFVDIRRFGRWKIGDWNPDRSPDLTIEFEAWSRNIMENIHHKDLVKPFYEFLMNQKWMNGYGNYLRAELCERLDINPFWAAKDVVRYDFERFCEIAARLPVEAYFLGGGQIYSWNNPLGVTRDSVVQEWNQWMKAYKNPGFENLIDNGGRRFWYHPKWK
jgi:endonuclease VIII-like 1